MALIKCPECQKEVSDSALCCPACGKQLKKLKRSFFGKLIKWA
ncbi:zinc-ribbon domain protein, partial [Escherichia coli 178900]